MLKLKPHMRSVLRVWMKSHLLSYTFVADEFCAIQRHFLVYDYKHPHLQVRTQIFHILQILRSLSQTR